MKVRTKSRIKKGGVKYHLALHDINHLLERMRMGVYVHAWFKPVHDQQDVVAAKTGPFDALADEEAALTAALTPEVEAALAECFPSDDPFDATEFDPVESRRRPQSSMPRPVHVP